MGRELPRVAIVVMKTLSEGCREKATRAMTSRKSLFWLAADDLGRIVDKSRFLQTLALNADDGSAVKVLAVFL